MAKACEGKDSERDALFDLLALREGAGDLLDCHCIGRAGQHAHNSCRLGKLVALGEFGVQNSHTHYRFG